MALNANALTTLSEAKIYLKITPSETSYDALIEKWINYASDRIERDCDRVLKKKTGIVEYQDGRRQNIITLKQWPIIQVTEVRIDSEGVFTDPSTLIPASEYQLTDGDNSLLYRRSNFPSGYRNIKVTYDAGYDPVPSDLELAALWLVFWQQKIRDAGDIGRQAKSKEGESISYLQSAPQEVKDTIASYRRCEFFVGNASTHNL